MASCVVTLQTIESFCLLRDTRILHSLHMGNLRYSKFNCFYTAHR
jgi:hypothetical protein